MGCGAATLTEVGEFKSPLIKDTGTTLLDVKHLQAQSPKRSPAPPGAERQAERQRVASHHVDIRSDTSSVSLEVVGDSCKETTPRDIGHTIPPPIPSEGHIAERSACKADHQATVERSASRPDNEAIVERLTTIAFALAEKKLSLSIAAGFVIAAASITARMPDVSDARPQPAVAVALAVAARSATEAGSATGAGLLKTAAATTATVARACSQRKPGVCGSDDIAKHMHDVAGHTGDLLLVEALAEMAANFIHTEGCYAADLASAAAGFAKYSIPETLQLEPHPDVAIGLAKVARAAAEGGSPTAVALIQATAASAANSMRSYCEIAGQVIS